jgi:hypothetical protein
MRSLFGTAIFVLVVLQVVAKEPVYKTPLSKYSREWDSPKYKRCNTAEHADYMSKEEKELIWILNLARVNPQLFRKTVLKHAKEIYTYVDTSSAKYYKSLDSSMRVMKPLGILKPDSLCALSARAHAEGSAATNYNGHWRQTPESKKVTHFAGECCFSGSSDPLAIMLVFLIDESVESLGHRRICFGRFTKLGTGLAPIKFDSAYINPRSAAVLDFDY